MLVCNHVKLGHDVAVIMDSGTEKLCDACRRKLCTCERCSAYAGPTENTIPSSFCCAAPGVVEVVVVQWCRDGWRQARPWTLDEVRVWLGLDGDDAEALGACERCGKYHLGRQCPVGDDDA